MPVLREDRKIRPGDNTPCGRAQGECRDIGNGIQSVSTPSHGGYFVPRHLLEHIPERLRKWAERWSQSEQWYEEDCCWAAVCVSFPDYFPADAAPIAQRIIDTYAQSSK